MKNKNKRKIPNPLKRKIHFENDSQPWTYLIKKINLSSTPLENAYDEIRSIKIRNPDCSKDYIVHVINGRFIEANYEYLVEKKKYPRG